MLFLAFQVIAQETKTEFHKVTTYSDGTRKSEKMVR